MFHIFSAKEKVEINKAVKELKSNSNARLIDVRTPQEYQSGHIPGSISLPLDHAQAVMQLIPDKKTKLFVYCQSGARSSRAVELFQHLGYEDAVNIGGITRWKGNLEN